MRRRSGRKCSIDRHCLPRADSPKTRRISDRGSRILVFDEGTVLLDVVDAETRRLLWRGWSESSFDGVVADQDWMEETIDRLVQQIFGRFPSRVRLVSLRH